MKKDKRIIFRVSDALDKDLKALASLEKKTISQYLRSLVENELTIESLGKKQKQHENKIVELDERVKEAIKKREKEIKKYKNMLTN